MISTENLSTMNYLIASNQTQPMKENESNSFSFSFNSREINPAELNAKIYKLLQEILDSRFSEFEKRRIAEKAGRLNFACPYCGDSYSELHKKRGNIYLENYGYHCYNCGKHTTIRGIFRDFSKQLDSDEIVYILLIHLSSWIKA
jgi:predicted RNA-binding Zn-ribbon protein involved in translation (DUF1610 family)